MQALSTIALMAALLRLYATRSEAHYLSELYTLELLSNRHPPEDKVRRWGSTL